MGFAVRARLLAAVSISVMAAAAATASEFQGLGDLPGGFFQSRALAVSADGSVVVGSGDPGSGGPEAFRWTAASGMVGLGELAGGTFASVARSVSADGSVVVGLSSSASGQEAFRWTQSGGMVGLGDLPGGVFSSEASGVSADGSVVVGYSFSANGGEAFRWTQSGGMVGLGDLPGGGFNSQAYGVSADGSVVVGHSESAASGFEAFRWTQAGGMVGLGDLPGGAFSSIAHGVSADGSVVVGISLSANGLEAFHWTAGSGMVGLGDLAGGPFLSIAWAASADGSVIVGEGSTTSGAEAFRWTQATGMQSVASLLAADGVNLGSWRLLRANGVSADGRTIVGTGINPSSQVEAFIAVLDVGLLTPSSLFGSLQAQAGFAGAVSAQAQGGLDLVMQVADRFGSDAGGVVPASGGGDWRLWQIAAHDDYDGDVVDGDATRATFGASYGVTDELRAGLGLSVGGSDGRFPGFSGDRNSDHLGVQGFLAYAGASGLRLSAAGLAEWADHDVTRGYLNGITPVSSTGEREGTSYGGALQAGWAFALSDAVSLTPFARYDVTRIELDAYTEVSGPFPARFDAVDDTVEIARAGLDASWRASERLDLWANASWAHRSDGDLPDVSGQVLIVLTNFTVPGAEVSQDWAEGGIGFGWEISPAVTLRGSVRAASDGDTDPSLGASLGLDVKL